MNEKIRISENGFINSKSNKKEKLFNLKNVLYISRPQKYVLFHYKNNTFQCPSTLIAVERMLPPNFCRVHREYIVNLNLMIRSCSDRIILKGDIYIPISRRRKKYVEEYIVNYLKNKFVI